MNDPRLEPNLPTRVKPDWAKARELIDKITYSAPNQDVEDAIRVYDDDGQTIFAIRSDGTVEAPDCERLGEAAVIFFREVMKVAALQGYKVPSKPEGWDA